MEIIYTDEENKEEKEYSDAFKEALRAVEFATDYQPEETIQ